nr:NYN domain-containing protein [Mangrovactinospora gilvigrisea]
MAEQGGTETLDAPLPEGVRQRVVAVAADALGAIPPSELPGPLRPYARFTPGRRAKYAATPLAAALEQDAPFRVRVGERIRRAQPDLVEALEAGTVPAAADPLDVAAAAYLVRPDGWTKLVAAAGDEAQKADAERADAEATRTITALREELEEARDAAKQSADRLRLAQDEAKREADGLRRRLRAAEAEMRRAQAATRKAEAELDAERAAASSRGSQQDAEGRRLRGRMSDLEAQLEAARKASREGRSADEVRLRLLLDTVLDAAGGLRRELALPPVSSDAERPADGVDAVRAVAAGPEDVAARALASDDPALLDQLLALPQAHMVVDGYNVTKAGYPTLPLEKQRLRLLGGLAALAAQSGAEVTCVFDGADLGAPVLLAPPRGVRVLFSKAGETADELIRRLVRAEPRGRAVVVVSSDREVADGIRKAGARPVASAMLLKRLARF